MSVPAGAGTLTPREGPRRRLPPSLRGECQRWLPSAAACSLLERLQVRGGLRRPPPRGHTSGAGRRATAVLRGCRTVRFRPLAERMTRARYQIESPERLMPASERSIRQYIPASCRDDRKALGADVLETRSKPGRRLGSLRGYWDSSNSNRFAAPLFTSTDSGMVSDERQRWGDVEPRRLGRGGLVWIVAGNEWLDRDPELSEEGTVAGRQRGERKSAVRVGAADRPCSLRGDELHDRVGRRPALRRHRAETFGMVGCQQPVEQVFDGGIPSLVCRLGGVGGAREGRHGSIVNSPDTRST